MKTEITGRLPALIIVCLLAASASAEQPGRIVFHSDRSGNSEIYSVNADGSDETRLTSNGVFDGFPSWSPDGKKIYFQSRRNDDDAIYVMAANGLGVARIPNTEHGRYPKISHDGKHLAFFAERDGQTDIFTVDLDGDNPQNLTSNPATDETPSWTQDDTRLAFQSDRTWQQSEPAAAAVAEHSNFGLFTMSSDGSGIIEITGLDYNDENPSISPDGKSVVFQRYVDDRLAVVSVAIETGRASYLTPTSAVSGSPAWSSSGRRIVFDSLDDGNFEIYVMNADGSDRRQITNTEGGENSGAALFDGPPLAED